MSEQVIWLGEEQIRLRPPDDSLSSLVKDKTAHRHQEDTEAKTLLQDVIHWRATAEDPVQKDLEEAAETLLKAPFSAYAAEFVNFMKTAKDHQEIAEAHKILEVLKGQTVFDIGNGLEPRLLQGFLTDFGIKGYIGVDTHNLFDKNHYVRQLDDFGDVMYLDEEEGDIVEGVLVRGDMLRVASRLPDQSVSIALMGIDEYIVNTNSPYGERLKEEIARIMHPSGIIFGRQAEQEQGGLLGKLEQLPELERIGTETGGLHFIQRKQA